MTRTAQANRAAAPPRHHDGPRESIYAQIASLVGFFVLLMLLKTFFLPLFIIPTGSMAHTLYGEHAIHSCPNCGVEYPVNWPLPSIVSPDGQVGTAVACPNCRWIQLDPQVARQMAHLRPTEVLTRPLRSIAGDRIFVLNWVYDRPFSRMAAFGPRRWDVVVFKVPTDGETNYIKRLIGLPGEKLEIIDGDVFINDRIERKSAEAQHALWFPYYDHDFPPQQASRRLVTQVFMEGNERSARLSGVPYHPRWVALAPDGGWSDLAERKFRFDGAGKPRSQIQFSTDPNNPAAPGLVEDFYSYNGATSSRDESRSLVRDVRLSVEAHIRGGGGYVELATTKFDDTFVATLRFDGSVRLEHVRRAAAGEETRETWGEWAGSAGRPVRLALANVDYRVSVSVDGVERIASRPEQYGVTPADARRLAVRGDPAVVRIAAEDVDAEFSHIRIDRDVYYTHGPAGGGLGVDGIAATLAPDAYFVCGDNSPNSADSRFRFGGKLGPHLEAAAKQGTYQAGTVPADQMIGRAFFVYWPGCRPKLRIPTGRMLINVLPDMGRVRWIH